jgi:hypothetical protein
MMSSIQHQKGRSPEKRATVVAVFGDAAGGSASAPVLNALKEDSRLKIAPLAFNQSATVWQDLGLDFGKIKEDLDINECRRYLHQLGASLVFVGVSAHKTLHSMVSAAKSMCIPSLGFLDCWRHYRRRFIDAKGEMSFLPDYLAIIDQQAKEEAIAEGLPAERLIITGSPAFDTLVQDELPSPAKAKERIMARYEFPSPAKFVLFASQPFSLVHGLDCDSTGHPGFIEHDILKILLFALEKLEGKKGGQKINLLIRSHPKENPEELLELSKQSLIETRLSTSRDYRDELMAADLVVGINSTLLIEACYLNQITISIQPDMRWTETLPTNRGGLSIPIYSKSLVLPTLEKYLFDENARADHKKKLAGFYPDGMATNRLARAAYNLLEMDPGF